MAETDLTTILKSQIDETIHHQSVFMNTLITTLCDIQTRLEKLEQHISEKQNIKTTKHKEDKKIIGVWCGRCKAESFELPQNKWALCIMTKCSLCESNGLDGRMEWKWSDDTKDISPLENEQHAPSSFEEVFKFLGKDETISPATKKQYKKNLNKIIEYMNKDNDSDQDLFITYIQNNQSFIKEHLTKAYPNLNTRISYFSVLKYVFKVCDIKDKCKLDKSILGARATLKANKSKNTNNEKSHIKIAEETMKQLIAQKQNPISPQLKIWIDIVDKLGCIRSAELITMRVYYDATEESNKTKNYIDCFAKQMIIQDHKTYNKTKQIKKIDISHIDIAYIIENTENRGLLFPQMNGDPYSDTTGFNNVIKRKLHHDFSTIRRVKVSLVFAYGTDENKELLSSIHGSSLETMKNEYQTYINIKAMPKLTLVK